MLPTATASTRAAASSIVATNTVLLSQSRIFNDSRSLGLCTEPCLTSFRTSSRPLYCSNLHPIKAMAGDGTLSIPKADSQTSGFGSKQALISLSDKKDLAFLGNGLQALGYTIVSTGGTASALKNSGVSVTKVEQLTCFPEMLDGRVKTLHPNIHGGILARRDQKHHMEALSKHGIGTFDVVVVNLYPFYDKVSSTGGIAFDDGIENIDIGGPAMIRAAAKIPTNPHMLNRITKMF